MRKFLSKALLLVVVGGASLFMLACGGGAINSPVVTGSVAGTTNPLVAQYTIMSGCAGQAMVEFGPDTTYGRTTAWYSLPGSYQRTVILVAGMKASTTYHMRSQTQCAGSTSNIASADSTFTTGPLPSLPFPALTVTRPNPSLSSQENPGIEMITVPTVPSTPAYFTDRDGNPIWYYDVGQGNYPFTFKLLPDGNIILSITRPALGDSVIREVDLAGNTIREMTIETLNQKVQSAGFNFVPAGFHHDVLPLSNGHLIVLVDDNKTFTDLPGYPGTTNVQGDALVDLDENWNPVWSWNSFDYLDVTRHLNGLPDWTHSNALGYLPNDGSLLLSMRHQSWVLKIDYSNGAGTGHVLWKLGYEGDFALTQNSVPTADPSVWFSFQHFPVLLNQSGSETDLAIWDNGDDRVLNTSGEECIDPRAGNNYPACYSRATVFHLDESAMVADLAWADTLSYYGVWGGSVNQLANGNIEFDLNSAAIPPSANVASEVQEVTQTTTPQVIWQMDMTAPAFAYRAYRVPSLYNNVTWP